MHVIHKTAFLSVLSMAALLLVSATMAYADTYQTDLSGNNEVLSVSTTTSGSASVAFDGNGSNMTYSLTVYNGDEITAAHLHCGDPGENGPAVVTLFSDSNGTDVNGSLASGSIGNQEINDVNCTSTIGHDIANVSDLAEAIQNGDIYVNVHSQAYPDGIARGQLPGNGNNDTYGNGHGDNYGDGYGGHGWKDDDHDGKGDWYQDRDGNWKDSCKDWSDDDHDGTHDWNHQDWDQWNKDHGDQAWKDDHNDKKDYDRKDDFKNDNKDWNKYNNHGKDGDNGKDGHDGKDGRDGKDGSNGNDSNRSNTHSSIHTGDARASASLFNLVNARSRISIH